MTNRKIFITLSLVMIIPLLVNVLFFLGVLDGHLDGYSGNWFMAAMGAMTNASIIFPALPMMPVVVETADQNGLVMVAGFYAAGATLGETVGYGIGRSGNIIPAIEHSKTHQIVERYMRGRGTGIVLFVLSLSPLPFDIGGMFAGSAKYPICRFWLATFAGRWIKYMVVIHLWATIENLLGHIPWIGGAASIFMFLGFLIFIGIMEREALCRCLSRKLRRRQQTAKAR